MDNETSWVHWIDKEPNELFEGIYARLLWQEGNRKAFYVDIAPGAKWVGEDKHINGPEELFVISGVFNDGVRDYPAGTFVHNPVGSSHVPQSTVGCTAFFFYPDG